MDDTISRQAAIDAISKKQGGVFDQDAEIDTAVLYVYSECKAIIKDLPSVQPRKGKWIEHDDNWANVYYECSVCKEPFVLIDGTPTENLYNFCPNCGADMRGEQDD